MLVGHLTTGAALYVREWIKRMLRAHLNKGERSAKGEGSGCAGTCTPVHTSVTYMRDPVHT